jgi:hypothetical protein
MVLQGIMPVTEEQQVSFRMGNASLSNTFLVCTLSTSASGILGMDLLEPRHAILNMKSKSLTFSRKYISNSVRKEYGSWDGERKSKDAYGLITHTFLPKTPRDNAHVTTARPVTGKNNDSRSTTATATDSDIPKAGNHKIQILESTSWLVKCSQSVTLSPRAKQVIKGRLLGFKRQVSPGLVYVEPAQLPIQCICAARGLSKVHKENHETQHSDGKAPVARANVVDHLLRTPRESDCNNAHSTPNTSYGTVLMMVANFSDEPILIPKATTLGVAEEISETLIAPIPDEISESAFNIPKQRKIGLLEIKNFAAIWMEN